MEGAGFEPAISYAQGRSPNPLDHPSNMRKGKFELPSSAWKADVIDQTTQLPQK